jgi:hypothetical protein
MEESSRGTGSIARKLADGMDVVKSCQSDFLRLSGEVWKSIGILKRTRKVLRSAFKEMRKAEKRRGKSGEATQEEVVQVEELCQIAAAIVDKFHLDVLEAHLTLYVSLLARSSEKISGLLKEIAEEKQIRSAASEEK